MSNIEDVHIRNQTVVMLRQVVLAHIENIDNISVLFEQMVRVLTRENVQQIRSVLLDLLAKLMNKQTVGCFMKLVEEAVTKRNKELIDASVDLVMTMKEVSCGAEMVPLVMVAMECSEPVNALKLGYRIWKCVPSEMTVWIWQKTVEVLLTSRENGKVTMDVCGMLIDAIDEGTHGDMGMVMSALLPLIGESEIDPETQYCYSTVVSRICVEMCEDTSAVFVRELISRYFALSLWIDHDVFEVICTFFSRNGELLSVIMREIETRACNPDTQKSSIQALSHCLTHGGEHLGPLTGSIASLLCTFLLHSSKSVRDATATAVHSFVDTFRDEDALYMLAEAVLKSLSTEYDDDLMITMSKIFGQLRNTDRVFHVVMPYLSKCIATDAGPCARNSFECLMRLIENSDTAANHSFAMLFELFSCVIRSTDPKFALIKDCAVDCLGALRSKCSLAFRPCTDEFWRLLEGSLMVDDTELQESAMKAVSAAVRDYPDAIGARGNSMVNGLIAINTGMSLATCCILMTEIPALYDELGSRLVAQVKSYLTEKGDSGDPGSCRCVALFVLLVAEQGDLDPGLAERFLLWAVAQIQSTTDDMLCGEAIDVLGELVQSGVAIDFRATFDVIASFFARSLPFFEPYDDYNEIVFPVMSFFLKLLIKKLGSTAGSLFNRFSGDLVGMCRSGNPDLRDFGIQLLGQFVESSGAVMSAIAVNEVFGVAFDFAERFHSPSALFVINQCASSAASVIPSERWNVLIRFLIHLLTSDIDFEAADNCVNAIGAVLQNVSVELPSLPNITGILNAMPARGCATENSEMMRFFLWLGQKIDFQPTEQFASVLIRLMSVAEHDMGLFKTDTDLLHSLKSATCTLFARLGDSSLSLLQTVLSRNEVKICQFRQNVQDTS